MNAGLCQSCKHVKALGNDRGSVFYMCRLAETRKEFLRYPRLPVLQCGGYEVLNRRDAENGFLNGTADDAGERG